MNASYHAEWQSLIDISGPFISLEVLEKVFPQGLEPEAKEQYSRLSLNHGEWLRSIEGGGDPRIHAVWIRWILREILGYGDGLILEGDQIPENYSVSIEEHQETLSPDIAIIPPPDDWGADENPTEVKLPRILVQILEPGQNMERPLSGRHWKASPLSRMMMLLRGSGEAGVGLGILTNGEDWVLVHSPPNEIPSHIRWLASLWLEERSTLRSFMSLVGTRRIFGVSEEDTLEGLFERSLSDQQTVTDQLGFQVRQGVEILVTAIDRADQDAGGKLVEGFSESDIYEAALTVMMRLVFLLYAEEQGLLPLGDPLYDENYAASTLLDQLLETSDRLGDDILERRSAAWGRLLATFRGVHGGIEHDILRLSAHGGGLFDPDRFPFIEGREKGTDWRKIKADPIPVDDPTIFRLMTSLQFLDLGGSRKRSDARRLSFKELGVEQIGHIYESLLDHTAKRASEPTLGLRGKKYEEPEVPLSLLEDARARGRDPLIKEIKVLTDLTQNSIRNALDERPDMSDGIWRRVCSNDDDLIRRIEPFANLIRKEGTRLPTVILKGRLYVTRGTDRRSTGTHYTPPSLTGPIARYTLEPMVYAGPAEGTIKEGWRLKSAREILALKVCDMAVGSGAFLVQACRYLSERLVEAWEQVEIENPGKLVITPEGDLSSGSPRERPIPSDPDERFAVARRAIADRCLYGVDQNPMAVEMAKLSLWLITLQKGRPFGFLDHAIKNGNALLGCHSTDQIRAFHPVPERGRELFQMGDLFDDIRKAVDGALDTATEKRLELEKMPIIDVRDTEAKHRLHDEAEAALETARSLGDLVTGVAIAHAASANAMDNILQALAPQVAQSLSVNSELSAELRGTAREKIDGGNPASKPPRKCFHWPLEFPEVFERDNPGFDALIGNPPFQGGQKITGEQGTDYRNYLLYIIAEGRTGSADLCAYFFLKAQTLLRTEGGFGFLATNTIAQGDTREVGLSAMVASDIVLTRAVQSRKWPGTANLEVSHVWGRNGEWKNGYTLDDEPVEGITPYLTPPGRIVGDPYKLDANKGKSFQGSIVLGMGFVMKPEEAQELIQQNSKNKDVLFPYLGGEDLNSRPDQSASRWVINFKDWPLDRCAGGSWEHGDERQRKEWLRDGRVPSDYPDPVAADYPDCLGIVEEKVKPQRMELRDDASTQSRRKKFWWLYASGAKNLYDTIEEIERVIVKARVSNTWAWEFVSPSQVLDDQLVVIAFSNYETFAVLQSSIHMLWASKHKTTMRMDMRYVPTRIFETFPFSDNPISNSEVAENYLDARSAICRERELGLTAVYNLFHDKDHEDPDIVNLRDLHTQMDHAVLEAYGWSDVTLGHDFRATDQGDRFTITQDATNEILDRLLVLNHERHAEEVAAGLHDKKKKKKKSATKKKASASRGGQIGMDL